MDSKRKTGSTVLMVLLIVAACSLSVRSEEAGGKHPVYVGVKVCASCHQGDGMGQQFSRWMVSKHARAYAGAGVHLIVTPRATPKASADKWVAGGRVVAVTAGTFSLSS